MGKKSKSSKEQDKSSEVHVSDPAPTTTEADRQRSATITQAMKDGDLYLAQQLISGVGKTQHAGDPPKQTNHGSNPSSPTAISSEYHTIVENSNAGHDAPRRRATPPPHLEVGNTAESLYSTAIDGPHRKVQADRDANNGYAFPSNGPPDQNNSDYEEIRASGDGPSDSNAASNVVYEDVTTVGGTAHPPQKKDPTSFKRELPDGRTVTDTYSVVNPAKQLRPPAEERTSGRTPQPAPRSAVSLRRTSSTNPDYDHPHPPPAARVSDRTHEPVDLTLTFDPEHTGARREKSHVSLFETGEKHAKKPTKEDDGPNRGR